MVLGLILSGVLALVNPQATDAATQNITQSPIVTVTNTLRKSTSSTTHLSFPKAEKKKDDRAERIDAYFEKRNMPLAGHGEKFVEVADSCGIDWRLLPAIGVRESSGGKHMMNNNPFGWGSARIPFTNFDHAIEEVGKNMCGDNPNTARYYKDKTTYQKLWAYNGTVMPTYPDEVIAIMNMF